MRTVLVAAAGLIAVLPGAGPASSAVPAVRVLHAHRVAEDAVLLGQADATTVAFRGRSGSVVVMRGDDGAVRKVGAPSGCMARAAGGGRVAYSCGVDTPTANGGVVHHLAVTSLAGDEAVRLAAVALTTVTVRGRWVVIRHGQSTTLHRCGTANPVTLPAPFSSPVLGDGWVGQLSRHVKETRWTVDLLRLSDRRRFTIRAIPGAARSSGSLMFTHGRLYIAITGSDHGGRTGAIFSVVLPRS